jgi:hypothetical protein
MIEIEFGMIFTQVSMSMAHLATGCIIIVLLNWTQCQFKNPSNGNNKISFCAMSSTKANAVVVDWN